VTYEQQLAVLRAYDEKFENWEPERADRFRNLPVGMGMGVKHARWMVQEMIRRLEADEEASPGQADRWIGFVQAIFWTHGIFSIDDMAKANTKPPDTE
jgi:hypothetical protein